LLFKGRQFKKKPQGLWPLDCLLKLTFSCKLRAGLTKDRDREKEIQKRQKSRESCIELKNYNPNVRLKQTLY